MATRKSSKKTRDIPVLEDCSEPCPIERAMRVIGGKWKGSILWHLKEEPLRFTDLANRMGGASRKVLTERLKEMEESGLIVREVVNDRPIAINYSLTKFGKTALRCLEELKYWSERSKL